MGECRLNGLGLSWKWIEINKLQVWNTALIGNLGREIQSKVVKYEVKRRVGSAVEV